MGGITWIGLIALLLPLFTSPPAPVSPAGAQAADLSDFGLVSADEGWLLAAGRLYWTASGGRSWQEITPPSLDSAAIRAVTFLDTRRGWLVLLSADETGRPAYALARTSDGGHSWQTRALSLFESGDPDSLPGAVYLTFLDAQTGWLVVKRATSSNFSLGSLFKTADGGDTWTRLTPAATGSANHRGLALPIGEPVYFATGEAGWTAGGAAGGELYQTRDGGRTWQPQNPSTGARFYRLPTFDSPQQGVLPAIAVDDDGTWVEFYTTSDGGRSWSLATRVAVDGPDTTEPHLAVEVIDAQHWLVSIPNSRRLLRISDSGEVETVVSRDPLAAGIDELEMATPDVGWARTMAGSCADTTPHCRLEVELLRTEDGGKSWSALPLPNLPLATALRVPGSSDDDIGSTQGPGSRTALFVGQGFDKCEVATLDRLQTWIADSPYDAVNLYIGGACRACANSGLTADLVAQASQQGWRFIPTWVGPQSTCRGGSCGSRISLDPDAAYNQGAVEASAAITAAVELGLALPDGSGTVIYYDLEPYTTGDATCREAARRFISGWTAGIQARGSLAGIYGSNASAVQDFAAIEHVPDVLWAAHWIYSAYNPDATVWGCYKLPDSLWANHQRIRQYAGGHNETWGGVTLNIDCDVIDGVVADLDGGCDDCVRVYLPVVLKGS